MLTRDIRKLCSGFLDVLVVGGGIHGATIGYHAAKAGYRTAIVEKNDFCGGASANSLKILHGGLRYLQHANIKRMRHSITARREMMRLAPYLVEPLPCMMPLYGKGLRGRGVMKAALVVNDCIGWDRNLGLPPDKRLPGGRILSKEQCLEVVPGIESQGLHGASVWHDALAVNTERLVLEYILESRVYGAQAANYTEVTAVEKESEDIYRVTLEDTLCNQEHTLKCRSIVNASGPWFEKSLGLAEGNKEKKQKWAMALNVVSRKQIFKDFAVALEGSRDYEDKDAVVKRGKRLYFFVPWRDYTMIGTDYEESVADPDGLQVKRETIQNMVDEINTIYPPARLRYEDISFFHAGLLPMRSEAEYGDIQLEKNSTFLEHADSNFSRVILVKGVKYTTAPHIAGEIVRFLQSQYDPSWSREKRVQKSSVVGTWDSDTAGWRGMLEDKYGPRAVRILPFLKACQGEETWIDKEAQLLTAEVQYMIAEEMACRLSDIVFRRSALGTADFPGRALLAKLSVVMGEILHWDAARQEQEIEEVCQRYSPLFVHQD